MPAGGATPRLHHLVGLGKAKELLFTGELMEAQEAKRIGLVNQVVPRADLKKTTLELAHKIASKSAWSLKMLKKSIHAGANIGTEIGLGFEALAAVGAWTSPDRVEGIHAFLEKRTALFNSNTSA